MMRKILPCLMCGILLIFINSCASAPKPAPAPVQEQPAPAPTPEPAPAPEPAPVEVTEPVKEPVPLPETQLARAEELRGVIAAYNLSSHAADEYAAGEEQYRVGKTQYGVDNEVSGAALEKAAVHYQSVIDAGADTLLARAEHLRSAVESGNLSRYAADEYAAGEEQYRIGKAKHGVDNGVSASASGQAAAHFQAVIDKGADALLARAEELRGVIAAYNLSSHAADEYAAGEEQYGLGRKQYGTDNEISGAAFAKAAVHYQAVIDTGANALLTRLVTDVDAARAAAVSAGAEATFPGQFAFSVSRYDEAVSTWKAGNYAEAGEQFSGAKDLFNALSVKMDIVGLNTALTTYGLEQYVATEVGEARMTYLAGDDLFEHDGARALRSYQSALDLGKAAVEKAATLVVGTAQAGADSAKNIADSVKASVAVKTEYAAAAGEYARGVQALKAVRWVDAYDSFESAAGQFASVYKLALEKRTRAEAALAEGKQRIEKLEIRAREAEEELKAAGVNPAEAVE